MRVPWTTPALRDIEKIGDQSLRERPCRDTDFRSVRQARGYPNMGRSGRVPGTRELVVSETPFVVPYRVREDEVQVLSVLHGARRWPERFP
jgi:toxin ParE1/3/4